VEVVTNATHDFTVKDWRPFSKNTLVGFVSLELPSGLIIHNVMLHERGDSRWVSMPAREYQKDGERSWVPLIEFADRDCRESFQRLALEAIDAYLAEGGV
jgi:DNA-binding cell septation regulator SpoVG